MTNTRNFGLTSKRAHIVGNGPSWKKFSKIRESDFVIGCNITRVLGADVTFLSDIKILHKICEKLVYPDCPIIANRKVAEWLKTNHNAPRIQPPLTVFDTYVADWEVNGGPQLSSAHYGAQWALRNGFTEVHVWGCDSLSEGHMFSYTDEIKPSAAKESKSQTQNTVQKWIEGWEKIIKDNPQAEIILHNLSK
jgi:hypothetical protein